MLEGSPKTLQNSQKHIMWTLVQYQTWQTVLRGLILSINKLCSSMLCSLSNKAVMYYGCSKRRLMTFCHFWWQFLVLSYNALVSLWNWFWEFDSNPEHCIPLLASVLSDCYWDYWQNSTESGSLKLDRLSTWHRKTIF